MRTIKQIVADAEEWERLRTIERIDSDEGYEALYSLLRYGSKHSGDWDWRADELPDENRAPFIRLALDTPIERDIIHMAARIQELETALYVAKMAIRSTEGYIELVEPATAGMLQVHLLAINEVLARGDGDYADA